MNLVTLAHAKPDKYTHVRIFVYWLMHAFTYTYIYYDNESVCVCGCGMHVCLQYVCRCV